MANNNPERGGGRGDAAVVHDRARVVRRYLSALDMRRPGRTAQRTIETINHRMHQVDTLLLSSDPVQRLHLTQERIDLHAELLRVSSGAAADFAEAEAAFVRVVRGYSERHEITFSAWRQIGVDADVLERGGVAATRSARNSRAVPASTPAPVADVAPAAQPEEPAAPAAQPEDSAAPADPSCIEGLPPVPRAEGPKAPAKATAKKSKPAAAARNGVAKQSTSTAKRTTAAKTARPAKKSAEPVQQQLPADASS